MPYRDDSDWIREGSRFGWELPPRATPFWRLPVIRHTRAMFRLWNAYHSHQRGKFRDLWYQEWLAHAIWQGWV